MKTIEFESNYGNFAYSMTAKIGENVNTETEWLAMQGLANISYRVAGSAVDKALGVKDRRSLEYSDADGERIMAAVSKKITEMEGKEVLVKSLSLDFAVTGQHEFGEKSTADGGKAARAMAELLVGNAAALAALGCPGAEDLDVIAKAIAKVNASVRAKKYGAKAPEAKQESVAAE